MAALLPVGSRELRRRPFLAYTSSGSVHPVLVHLSHHDCTCAHLDSPGRIEHPTDFSPFSPYHTTIIFTTLFALRLLILRLLALCTAADMSIPLGVIAYQASSAPAKPKSKQASDKESKSPDSVPTGSDSNKDHKTLRSPSLPSIFKGFRRTDKDKDKENNSPKSSQSATSSPATSPTARNDSCTSQDFTLPKHLNPDLLPRSAGCAPPKLQVVHSKAVRSTLPLPPIASPGSLHIPGPLLATCNSSPALRGQHRHVEIVIPKITTWTPAVDTESVPLLSRPSPLKLITKTITKEEVPPINVMSIPPMSRSSTLDSAASAPSPEQLYSRNGSGANPQNALRSTSSLGKRDGYDSGSEQESVQTALRATSQQPPTASISPVIGQAGSAAVGSSNLSGLVCNVHRTTGKEPHALVGATTTILGDKLYVFGGRRISRTRPSLTSDLYELDLLRRHWTKLETKGDIPPPRYFHSMCALGDNKLVCYGGMSPDCGSVVSNPSEQPDAQVSVMSDVHIFDVPTRTWMKVTTAETPQGRYAHCAAILPSSAAFASANAPMSAIQHNPAGSNPNQGSLGVSLDGTGGAEMIVVGGQDSANHYIEQISVFNLRSLRWTSTKPMLGRSCGAYRSVVTPLTSMSAAQVGAGSGRADEDDDDADEDSDPNVSGSPMLIYTNYNFLDVKLELQVRLPDGSLTDKPMQVNVSPPGLRFPSGGIIDNNFVVAGTFLTSSKQEYALWALDLRTLTWARIDTGSSVFSQGSWNRGVLWNRRNAFIILGNRKRNLVDDYNNRRLNFSNICLVQLEAFGLYDNPRKMSPTSGYVSMSAPVHERLDERDVASGGRQLIQAAIDLGDLSSGLRELADMDFLSLDGTRVPVNSRLVARRWGSAFNALLQEGVSSLGSTDTATLRPGTASIMSRNSSITITPSVNTGYSNATTLTVNSGNTAGTAASKGTSDLPDPRSSPPSTRPRTLYLPHTVPTLQALIHYLYTSSLPLSNSVLATPQILCSLLQLARPYKIDGLLEAVVQRLHESLDGRNAAAIFNAAAMGAGGGEGLVFAAETTNVHPPRTASLGGINIEGLNFNNPLSAAGRSVLRIDTDVANNVNGGGELGSVTEDDEIPDSASTTASMGSQLSLARRHSKREDRVVWNGGWSAVIGLQKRGLRGLMEGRRMRERGKSDGGSLAPENMRVGLGIA